MPLVKVYSTGKKKVSEMELDEQIFNTEIKDYLLHDAVRMQLAKRRAGTASTRNRSAVRGGVENLIGKKGPEDPGLVRFDLPCGEEEVLSSVQLRGILVLAFQRR